MNPGNQELMFNYGTLLFELGRYSEAAEWLGQVSAESPNDTTMGIAYATSLYGSGRVGEAIAEFERVLRVDPNDTLALHNLILAHLETPRNVPAAETALRRLEDVDPAYAALPTLRSRLAAAR
jgi:tetratricopeptide (TPR) repeat protein